MSTYETTEFVNIGGEDFTFYNGNEPYTVKAGESKRFPIFLAKHGAKHLLDKILQEKYEVKDTLRDTPVRRDLMSRVLPEEAQKAEVKPLSDEEFKTELLKTLQKQQDEISEKLVRQTLEIESLKKTIAELEKKPAEEVRKRGRPKNP